MLSIIERKNEEVVIAGLPGGVRTFHPSFDLARAKDLLLQINNLKTPTGIPLYASWQYKGYYLLPAFQEFLFWSVCVPLVWHQEAWAACRGHQLKFPPQPYAAARGMQALWDILHRKRSFIERCVYNFGTSVARALSPKAQAIVVYDDGEDGFRYRHLKNILKETHTYTRLDHLHTSRGMLNWLQSRSSLCIGKKAWKYPVAPSVDYASAPFLHSYLSENEFFLLLNAINRRCYDAVAEAKSFCDSPKAIPSKLVLGYDQLESALGYLIACKVKSIPIVTFQHGLFTKYHAGWIAPGIPREYCNVVSNTLIVWGDYWRDVLIEHSNKYLPHQIVVGGHLRNNISHKPWPSLKPLERTNLSVLIPYEFLSDNKAISAYMRAFLALGWHVYVKQRPPAPGTKDADTDVYDDDIRPQLKGIDVLDESSLSKIDVIACTQTTLAYELMSCNKPIWYLETPFQFIDIVEEGIAHSISLNMIPKLTSLDLLRPLLVPRHTMAHYKLLFSDIPLRDTIHKFVH